MGRAQKLAELVYQTTLERQTIAILKDELQDKLWYSHPRKHRELYNKYEPRIKRHAHRLADLEAKLRKPSRS